MSLAEIERELISRGYRIRYRRPDDHFIVTYQVEKDGATMGWRMTEQFADEMIPGYASRLIDKLEREWAPDEQPREEA